MNEPTPVTDNSSGGNGHQMDDGPSLHTRMAFAGAWIIIAVAGVIDNSLVIFVAMRFQKMNNVTNCFIVNLAVTDIVFLAFCMPLLVVQYTTEHWSFDQIFCKLLNFISFVSVLVTVLTLVAMTIDRYIYVVRPFENLTWRKPQTVFLLSFFIWLISCCLALPFLYHYGVTTRDDNQRQCVLRTDDHLQVYFRLYTVTLYYFIPLTIIVISYTKLLYYVYSKENKIKPKSRQSIMKWSKKRRAVTRMVAIVTLVFAVCWLPITLYIVSANHFPNKTALLYYFKIIANSCAYLNSAINPVLYAFLNRSFRTNCGSLFSEPACSLFCADEERHSQLQQRQHPKVPISSTTLDRFRYPSTNRESSTSTREKRRKKVLILDQHPQFKTSHVFSQNEVTELEYDLLDKKDASLAVIESKLSFDPEPVRPLAKATTATSHARTTSL